MPVVAGLGGEGVAVGSFVDSGVGAFSSGWVESFEEFIDRSLVVLGFRGGGKMPPGR